ncbi:hypothetical protein DAH56_20625 [Sphingomonas koreensis]|jgi:preprotein translocase subunit SecB|nr:hypothetical protein DAH56_20625 [Sphingomonas koreensis]
MDAQTYNSIVARANLRSIRLTTNRFDMKPEALDLDPDAWRNNISATMVQSYLEPESGSLYGILSYEVVCRQGRKRILSVSATYFVSYKIQGECDQAAGELFVERVGKVAAYPYFRTLVASLTSQAGLMMRPLPVLSFAPRSVDSAANLEQSRLVIGTLEARALPSEQAS